MNFFSILKLDLKRFFGGGISGYRLWVGILYFRFWPVLLIRLSSLFYEFRFLKIFAYLTQWLNVFLFGVEYTPRCKIGAGLLIPHGGCIVIGAFDIGENVTIFQGVTLGSKSLDRGFSKSTRPTVCSDVVIGAGAKVFGGITLGKGSFVYANSLLTKDLEDNSVACGVPATVTSVTEHEQH